MKQLPWLAILVFLAGCAATSAHRHGGVDACTEYRETIVGKSVEEQRRAAEQHIVRRHGSADAAHIERHLRMMEQRCAGNVAEPRRPAQ